MSNDINPYAAPDPNSFDPVPPQVGSIVPTIVDAGSIINYAFEVWKANLKLLVGVTAVVLGVSYGLTFAQGILSEVFRQMGQPEVGGLLALIFSPLQMVVNVFLGIGQTLIALRLLRGQPAQFSDLFSGGPLFLPVLGASLLAGLAMTVGFAACILPGLLLGLFFWPFYWLVVDQKTGVMDSFKVALAIAKVNVGTTVLIWLASMAIILLGLIALVVGLLFAIPLVSLVFATAYLMMAGLLSPRP
mgnify:CR=1 FL=1